MASRGALFAGVSDVFPRVSELTRCEGVFEPTGVLLTPRDAPALDGSHPPLTGWPFRFFSADPFMQGCTLTPTF